jgi:hypothetical protein
MVDSAVFLAMVGLWRLSETGIYDAIRLLDATLQILLDSMRQHWRITGCYRNSRLATFATGRTCQRAVFVTYADRPSKFWWNAVADGAILKPYTLSQTILKQCSLIQANVLKQYSRRLLVDRRRNHLDSCISPTFHIPSTCHGLATFPI